MELEVGGGSFSSDSDNNNYNGGEVRIRIWRREMRKVVDVKEVKRQVVLAVPMIITNAAHYFIPLVSVMFAGHLGEIELAAATLANSCATVTGLSLMIGLSGALETLCGQAFGANKYKSLGLYLQSSIITSFIFSVIVAILWIYSESILVLLHQDPQVSKFAGRYMSYLIPGMFAYGFLQCCVRFLQVQTPLVVTPLIVCSLIPLALHVAIAYVLVHRTPNLGYKGAALAFSVSMWVSFLMLAFYIRTSKKLRSVWGGFSTESFHLLLPNLKLAIPSAVMVCLEFGVFELVVLLAGLMPSSKTSTSLVAICANIENAIYMFTTCGLSAAVSTRVSNEIGAGNIEEAKNAMAMTLKLSFILALLMDLSLLFGHGIWAALFTDSPAIKKAFASMIPLLISSVTLDTAQGVFSGVARGCGWQHLAALTNLIAFYAIGTPIGIVLGFKISLHAKGLWTGLICGLFCQVIILSLIALRIKWTKIGLPMASGAGNENSAGV